MLRKADRPLAGVTVVDYSHFLAGPFMSRALAALGADVVKVERRKEGDAGRAHAMIKNGQSTYSCSRTWASRACA